MPIRVTVRLAPALLMLAMASGCGGTSVEAVRVLRDGANATAAIHTVVADIKFGQAATIQGFQAVSGTSRIRLPADSDTTLTVRQGDALLQAELLIANGKAYFRPTTLFPFAELTASQAAGLPDLSHMLDRAAGLPAVIPQGVGATYVASETVDGKDCYRIRATYTAAQVHQALEALNPTGNVSVTFWVDKGDSLIRRVVVVGKLYDPTHQSTLELHLHDFNKPVQIQAPA